MRCLWLPFGVATILLAPAWAARDDARSPYFALRVQQEYLKAKNPAEILSITHWCEAEIKTLNFKEVEAAMMRSIKALEVNDLAKAATHTKTVSKLDEQSAHLAKIICKPE